MDALDEIKVKNARLEKVDPETILNKVYRTETVSRSKTDLEKDQDNEDDRIAKQLFTDADGDNVRRIVSKPPATNAVKPPTTNAAPLPKLDGLVSLKRKGTANPSGPSKRLANDSSSGPSKKPANDGSSGPSKKPANDGPSPAKILLSVDYNSSDSD